MAQKRKINVLEFDENFASFSAYALATHFDLCPGEFFIGERTGVVLPNGKKKITTRDIRLKKGLEGGETILSNYTLNYIKYKNLDLSDILSKVVGTGSYIHQLGLNTILAEDVRKYESKKKIEEHIEFVDSIIDILMKL